MKDETATPFPAAKADEHHDRMQAVRIAMGIARGQGVPSRIDAGDIEDHYGVGEFPAHALPPELRVLAEHYAEKHGLPLHVAAIMVLSVVGATVKHRVTVHSIDDAHCHPNLHVLGALPTAYGKSNLLNDLMKPLRVNHAQRRKDFEEFDRPRLERKLVDAKKTMQRYERGKGATGEDYERAVRDVHELKRELRCHSGIYGDATEEAMVRSMQYDYGWAFSVTPEASKMLSIITGQYSKTTSGELFTSGFSGEPYTFDRSTDGTRLELERAVIACLWFTQPDQLVRIGTNPRLFEMGFVARFITVAYTGPIKSFASRNGAISRRWEDAFVQMITALEHTYLNPTGNPLQAHDEMGKLVMVQRPEEVEAYWKRKRDEIEATCALSTSKAVPFLRRLVEQSIKIALTFHLLKYDEQSHLQPLDMETAEQAMAIADWYARSGANLYEQTESLGDLAKTRKLVTMLQLAEGRSLAVREVCRSTKWSAPDLQGLVDQWNDHKVFCLATLKTPSGHDSKRVSLTASDPTLVKLRLAFK